MSAPHPDDVPELAAGERVVLLGKPGCHLCEDAHGVVASVCDEKGIGWCELDISTGHPVLWERFWDQIPVLVVDGRVRSVYRVNPARLRSAIAG